MSTETPDSGLGRRRLLRRASTVAAGVVGAGAVSAAMAAPAQAAAGEPIVQGENTAATPDPMVTLANTDGPALNLAPSSMLTGDEPVGSLRVDEFGNLWTIAIEGLPEMVLTSYTATALIPVVPSRILDTRNAAGRQYIINPTGNLDSAGRLLAGKTIHIHVGDLAENAVALHGNVTVTGAAGDGYLTVWPGGEPRPATSAINFPVASKLTTIANHLVVGIGYHEDQSDVISIFNSSVAAHVLLDVSAWTGLYGFTDIKAGLQSAAARGASRAAKPLSRIGKQAGKPTWSK
ncbi:hypothetical protein O7635_09815 [Asanoa sp. WMMD1127]|uniref:hypothetical protein n=1 Tax=Asanoa sp. WMMD1127 TaxID=3016107 RepID=UPI0024173847|nr:hypothetical protein [Asanoa sp. WMMD1127]MDG4822149.1 hypothetical protein [Asanoa sp. WMMD1127]